MARHEDAAMVDAFLRSLAQRGDDGAPPDARAVLRRAQLRAGLEAEQRRADQAALPLIAAALLAPLLALAWGTPVTSGATGLSVALVTAAAGTFAVRLALVED